MAKPSAVVAVRRYGSRFILCTRCGRYVRPLGDKPDVPAGHVRPNSRHLCRPKEA